MSDQEIKGIIPAQEIMDEAFSGDVINPGVMDEAMKKAEGKELPLTLEDGTVVGIAKVKEVDDGFEVEAVIDEDKKASVNLEGTALSLSSSGARIVNEQQILEKEQKELNNLFGLYSALKDQRKTKEKTQRRAKNKRARKSRRGNR